MVPMVLGAEAFIRDCAAMAARADPGKTGIPTDRGGVPIAPVPESGDGNDLIPGQESWSRSGQWRAVSGQERPGLSGYRTEAVPAAGDAVPAEVRTAMAVRFGSFPAGSGARR